MGSVGRRVLEESILPIVLGAKYHVDLASIGRSLMENGLLEPVLDLYYKYGSPVPIAIIDERVYVPIGIAYVPFPEHEAVIFIESEEGDHCLMVPLVRVLSPGLYSNEEMMFQGFNIPLRLPEHYDEDTLHMEVVNCLLKKVFNKTVKVNLLEEFLPYFSSAAVEYVRKGLPALLYDIDFLTELVKLLETLDKEERRRIRKFLRSFPGIGYYKIKLGNTSQQVFPYFEIICPTYFNEIVLLKEDNNVKALINGYRITRPVTEHGIIIDLLPASENSNYYLVYKGSSYPLNIVERFNITNPLTGKSMIVRVLRNVRGNLNFLLY